MKPMARTSVPRDVPRVLESPSIAGPQSRRDLPFVDGLLSAYLVGALSCCWRTHFV